MLNISDTSVWNDRPLHFNKNYEGKHHFKGPNLILNYFKL